MRTRFKLISTVIAIAIVQFSTLSRLAVAEKSEILIPIEKIDIQHEFSSQESVQLSIFGYLSNSCMGKKKSKIYEISPYVHQIAVIGSQDEGICLTVVTPFFEVLEMPNLSRGAHTIIFLNSLKEYQQETFTIF